MSYAPSGGRRRLVPLLAALALLLSACGMRVSREEIVAASTIRVRDAAENGPATAVGGSPDATADGGEVADGQGAPAQATPAQADQPGAGGAGPPTGTGGGTAATGPTAVASTGPARGAPRTGDPGAGPAPGGSGDGAAPTTNGPTPVRAEVVIGHVGEYSGIVGSSSRGGDTIARVGAAWINAQGGLNGHPVKLLVGDSGSDPNRYLSLVKEMVESGGAIAFFGNVDPLTAPAAETYLREKRVPMLSGAGSHSLWCDSPIRFFPGACARRWGLFSAKAAALEGKPKLGVFVCREAEVCRLINQAFSQPDLTKTGAQVVYTAEVSLAQPSFTSECLQAQSRGVQALVVLAEANTVIRAARDCVQQGFQPQFHVLDGTLTDSLRTDPKLDGLTSMQPQFPWVADDTPGAQRYRQALQRYAPDTLESSSGALAWVGAMMLHKAGADLPAVKPTSADILNGLWSLKDETFDGLTVPVTFGQGRPSPDPNCMFLLKAQGGKFVAPMGSKPVCL